VGGDKGGESESEVLGDTSRGCVISFAYKEGGGEGGGYIWFFKNVDYKKKESLKERQPLFYLGKGREKRGVLPA